MTWTSVIWVFASLFLLAFAGTLTLLVQHIGKEARIEFALSLFFLTDYTRSAYILLLWSAIYALIPSMSLTGLYALVVSIVKFLTK